MIIPAPNMVVIKLIKHDKLHGIALPDRTQIPIEMELEVIAIGSDVNNVKIGDKVICKPIDCVFLDNWAGVSKECGIVLKEKILGKIKLPKHEER